MSDEVLPSLICWGHVFARNTEKEMIDVLLDEILPNPSTRTGTYQAEQELGLQPSVYAYLGHFYPSISGVGIILKHQSVTGDCSACDSGGITSHYQPICGLSREEKRDYFEKIRFPSEELANRFKSYPAAYVNEYLEKQRPKTDGPCSCFGIECHDLWLSQDAGIDWRVFAYECRAKSVITSDAIVKWAADKTTALRLEEAAA